jgi:TolB-like protein
MPGDPFSRRFVSFGEFEADLQLGRLFKRGVKIKLREQSFRVLKSLLENPGQVVTREDLRRRLWPGDVFVDFENSLNTAVGRLREALGDSADHPRFIETLPKRGYRFLAAVSERVRPTTSRVRLAVLPFANLTGDTAQEYFADAMTDEIITVLATLAPEQLAVIARTTAMHYKVGEKDVAGIGRELGVDYLVEGAVHHTDKEVSVTAKLIQAWDQAQLFAGRYAADLQDIFQLQQSIAHDIAAHIPSVGGKVRGQKAARKPTGDLVAWKEYIQGRCEMWKWTPEGVEKARRHFEAALARDPRFALACDGLANLYGYLGYWGFLPPDEMEPLRRFYGLRAFELDPTLAEPRTHVAYRPEKCRHEDAYSYNWLEAEREMAQARDLNPNSPLIRVRYAAVLLTLGLLEQADEELKCALELDPLSLEVRFWLVLVLFLGRQYERGLVQAREFLELEPAHHMGHFLLGLVYLGMERYEESVAALRRAAELSNEFPFMLGWFGMALGFSGRTAEAKMVLERLRGIACKRFVLPTSFAWVHLGLREIDEAFAWMDRAVYRNDEWVHAAKTWPFLDPLRADPRYYALLRKINVEL